jgi:hypothetical protein
MHNQGDTVAALFYRLRGVMAPEISRRFPGVSGALDNVTYLNSCVTEAVCYRQPGFH